jgi:ribonucleoside-diphosphate reductase alpha chain
MVSHGAGRGKPERVRLVEGVVEVKGGSGPRGSGSASGAATASSSGNVSAIGSAGPRAISGNTATALKRDFEKAPAPKPAAAEPVAPPRLAEPAARAVEPAPAAEPRPASSPVSAQSAAKTEAATRIAVARLRGYEGESCSECGNFTMVRNGTCLKCDTCGNTSGCS